MFIEVLILGIIIGYLLKGKIENLQFVTLYRTYIVFIAFSLEAIIMFLIRKQVLVTGWITFAIDLIMYLMLFSFVYFNRKNKWIVIIGIGFLLNAIPIFLNGGTMPVSFEAMKTAGLDTSNVNTQGLYTLINSSTKLWFLGDIFPKAFLRHFVVSIGDIVSALGLLIFIIAGMTRSNGKN